jgi:hypothetical protein
MGHRRAPNGPNRGTLVALDLAMGLGIDGLDCYGIGKESPMAT